MDVTGNSRRQLDAALLLDLHACLLSHSRGIFTGGIFTDGEDPYLIAAWTYFTFINIHPYMDGNGKNVAPSRVVSIHALQVTHMEVRVKSPEIRR